APHARRCELDFRNHLRGPIRRAQGAQEGWTPERFAAHVVVAFPEKGLRVHHEALKGVHRPPPSTNFLRWPSRRYARFRTPSPSRGPPPQGGVLPGGNPRSRKRRYRPPRWPGASLASARVRLAESARPPWPRSPAPPPPIPSSPRDRTRSQHETMTVHLENPLDLRPLQLHTDSEGLEQVRAAAAAGDHSMSVLRHSHAGAPDEAQSYRANVERGQPSSACPTQVDSAPAL